jgi:hypothetical protein
MKMNFTDEQLHELIPHVIATVEGEPTLVEKLCSFLEEAEVWTEQNFLSDEIELTSDIIPYAQKVVAYHAFLTAIPALDLVLTPNGFGIVNTTTIVPASKERIERLQLSIESLRDTAIEQLLHHLMPNPTWQQTPQGKYFASTLFPTFHVCRSLNINVHLWQNFQSLHTRLIKIESVLAETYFSHEQMQAFRAEALGQMRHTSPLVEQVIRTLQSYELQLLTDIQVHPQCYYDLVTIIRSHPTEFPAWHQSPIADLYTPKVFENKKNTSGFWF